MKKVTHHKQTYKVIEEASLVTTSQPKKNVISDLVSRVNMSVRNLIYDAMCLSGGYDYFDEPVVANAYCCADDEFNERTGIDVCESKLALKQYKQLLRQCDKAYNLLMKASAAIRDRRQDYRSKIDSIESDLERTYGRLPL